MQKLLRQISDRLQAFVDQRDSCERGSAPPSSEGLEEASASRKQDFRRANNPSAVSKHTR
jgi:hypothetical protein